MIETNKTNTDMIDHYEVYFKMHGYGWFLGGYRDEKSEAIKYGEREVTSNQFISTYELRAKKTIDPIKL